MHIVCPHCRRSYPLDEELTEKLRTVATIVCARCKRSFPAVAPAEAAARTPAESPLLGASATEQQELDGEWPSASTDFGTEEPFKAHEAKLLDPAGGPSAIAAVLTQIDASKGGAASPPAAPASTSPSASVAAVLSRGAAAARAAVREARTRKGAEAWEPPRMNTLAGREVTPTPGPADEVRGAPRTQVMPRPAAGGPGPVASPAAAAPGASTIARGASASAGAPSGVRQAMLAAIGQPTWGPRTAEMPGAARPAAATTLLGVGLPIPAPLPSSMRSREASASAGEPAHPAGTASLGMGATLTGGALTASLAPVAPPAAVERRSWLDLVSTDLSGLLAPTSPTCQSIDWLISRGQPRPGSTALA